MRKLLLALTFLLAIPTTASATTVTFQGDEVRVNGVPTNKGGTAEGLLLSSRMVHAAIHDYNSKTAGRWAYPGGGGWSATRNVNEFIAALPSYENYGLDMVTVSMMGGHPRFKCADTAPSARDFSMFTNDGSLRTDAKARLGDVIRAADARGLIVNVQYFYRTENLSDAAQARAIDQATTFLKGLNTGNILIEVANESSEKNYDGLLAPSRIHTRVEQVHDIWPAALVSVSLHAGVVYSAALRSEVDWASLHTNALSAGKIANYVGKFRSMNVPIAITEDHWSGDTKMRNAVQAGAGYGYFDQGCEETGRYTGTKAHYSHGFQSLPVNWSVNTSRKQAFFNLVRSYDS